MSTATTVAHVHADWLLARPGTPALRGAAIRMEGGRIAAVEAAAPTGNGLIALPGLANAHDHARAFRTTAFGGFDARWAGRGSRP